MAPFLIGVLALGLCYLTALYVMRADPKALAKTLKNLLGTLLLAGAIVLLFSGRYAFYALPLGIAGFAVLLGGGLPRKARTKSSNGNGSTVRTQFLAMELDHASGQMDGVVLSGAHKEARLTDLGKTELEELYKEILEAGDNNSLSLIEAYFNSVFPGWREDFHSDSFAGHGSATASGSITEEEAYEILGLAPGASVDDIRAAHRRLMMKLHPDRGGSTALAIKINEAKDFLLGTHSSTS